MKRLWNDEAKAYVLEHAAELDLDALMDGLVGIEGFARTRLSVLAMRHKMGLSTRPSTHWTTEDEAFLRTAYRKGLPDEEIGKALGRTSVAVSCKRKNLRLTPERTIKKTITPGCYVTNWQDITEEWRRDFIDKVCADLARDDIKHKVCQRKEDGQALQAVWRKPSVDTIPERSETWQYTYGR